jgi:hypothetical protein
MGDAALRSGIPLWERDAVVLGAPQPGAGDWVGASVRIRRSAALVVALALLPASPAAAGTVSMPLVFSTTGGRFPNQGPYDEYQLEFRADPGEANRLSAGDAGPATVRISDTGAPLSAGKNCRQDAPNTVTCAGTGAPGVLQILHAWRFELGDGDDALTVERPRSPWPETTVIAGPGDDEVRANDAPLSVDGGPAVPGHPGRDGASCVSRGRT